MVASGRPTFVPLVLVLVLGLAAVPLLAGDATVYGAGTDDAEAREVTVAELLAEPDRYVGQKVRVSGRITDVCPRRGCWIEIAGTGADTIVRFKVKDGEIVFPVGSKGHDVVAVGVVSKQELTREEAVSYLEHLAEERNEPFDAATVTGPLTRYQIEGSGAIVR